MIPDPDYSDEESDPKGLNKLNKSRKNLSNAFSRQEKENKGEGRFDENGLVIPKKLPHPCKDSADKKSLHKELLFNQRLGKNVLNQKSELQKAMEKHKDKKAVKEQEKEKQTTLSPLQKAIDERAQKMEKQQQKTPEEPATKGSTEFEKVHAKLRSKLESP